jgi:hypothetical protein
MGEVIGSAGDLRSYLEIMPPDDDRADLSLSFSRSKEVDIAWREIIGPSSGGKPFEPSKTGTEAFQAFFAQKWGFADPYRPTPAELDRVFVNHVVYEAPRICAVTVATGILNPQKYKIIALNRDFTKNEFRSTDEYLAMWAYVERVEVTKDLPSTMEELDLSPGIIWRQFRELKSLEKLGAKVSDKADVLIDNVGKSEFLDADEIGTVVSNYMGMKSLKTDVEEKLIRLKDQAEDLGYIFNITDNNIVFKFPDNTTQAIPPGELFQPYLKTLTWQTQHTRRVISYRGGWFGYRIRVRTVTDVVQHTETVTAYKKFVIDFDPWVEKERDLASKGFRSYRFERVGGVYRTAGGTLLEEVMQLCERDRGFWEKCVVWLPIYDQKLTGGEVLTKYLIITRPVRGIDVIHLPRLFVEEHISVRRKPRVRVEVGELAHTINLGPGEKRTITIERSTTTEREDRRAAKSLVDLVETDASDFATEFEKEARKETERANSTTWSAKASGSWGGASASASGGGTSSSKTSTFARNLEKIARKASRNVTRKTQEEISTSTSTKTTVNISEKNVVELHNINPGASLNLAFYRLNNVSTVGSYLDQLEIVVLPGVEVIAGSGLVLPEVYPVSELPAAINRLALNAMPVTSPDPQAAHRVYGKQLLLDFIESIWTDYKGGQRGTDDAGQEVAGVQPLLTDESAPPEELEKIRGDVKAYNPAADPGGAALEALVVRLSTFLTDAQVSGDPIGGKTQDLVSGSAGFYMDSYVGVREGVELYAKDARQLDLNVKVAEAQEGYARAAYYRSLTKPSNNAVNGKASTNLKELELTFADQPLVGEWRIFVDGADAEKSIETKAGTKTYKAKFDAVQPWLSNEAKNLVQLVHVSTQTTLALLI